MSGDTGANPAGDGMGGTDESAETHRVQMPEEVPAFICGRDHPRGPGAWCIFGPLEFYMPVPDRGIGIAIANWLSGVAAWTDGYNREDWLKSRTEDPQWFLDCAARFRASFGGETDA